MHISQLSEEHVAKVKDVLKVGQEVEARVIKVDKAERRIGLSIKAANYSEEELKREAEAFDTLRPGEDMVGLEQAFQARPGGLPSRRRQEIATARLRRFKKGKPPGFPFFGPAGKATACCYFFVDNASKPEITSKSSSSMLLWRNRWKVP